MQEIKKENFEEEIVQSQKPVLIDFWGPQCGPCLALMPEIEALSEKYKNKLKVVKVEAPKNRRLCMSLRVISLPTILLYEKGKEINRFTGNITINAIEQGLSGALES